MAREGLLKAAKAMATTTADLLEDRSLLARIVDEFKARKERA
jgi:hypothetical protein